MGAQTSGTTPRHQALLLAVAFASGASALIYQTVWLRWFRVLFGNTAYAASATLCAFFLGLAIGAAIFGRVTARSRRPLLLYAGIEVVACGLALLVPLVVTLYDPLYAYLYAELSDSRALFVAAKFGLALLAMLPMTLLLGGTLPPLAAAYVGDPAALGRSGNRLYAVNTAGAVVGTALGALTLPEWIGVNATYGVAIAFALAAAGGAAALQRSAPAPARIDTAEHDPAPLLLRVIAFASGFGTLALEILFLRAFSQVVASSVYSYGAVLIVVLIALALGAALVAESEGRIRARPLLTGALVVEALLLLLMPAALSYATDGLSRWVSGELFHALGFAALFGGPPLLVGALVLPLTFRLAAGGTVGSRVGGLVSANTLGGVVGSLAASFVLLDGIGLWPSYTVVAAGYGALAIAVSSDTRRRLAVAVTLAVAAAFVLLGPTDPRSLPIVSTQPGMRVVAIEEGAHGVVSVLARGSEKLIKVDNHYALGGSGERTNAERGGHIPLLLHPDPKRVLFLGSATGGTAASAVVHSVDEIVLVELVPEVHELAAAHFAETTRGLHRDPRTRLVVEDGRNHLRAAPEQYDVVVADLFVPWRPGVGSLYTVDHFTAVREHLTEGGVFMQWLPLYQLRGVDLELVIATFLAVFPDATIWRGDFFASRPRIGLLGIRGDAPSVDEVSARMRELADAGVTDRWMTDPRGFWMLYLGPLSRYATAEVRPNSDDWPRFEFLAGRSWGQRRDLLERDWWKLSAAAGTAPDPIFPNLPDPGPTAGALFHRAAALSRTRPAEARAMAKELRRIMPPELLDPPDPTISLFWPPKSRGLRASPPSPGRG